MTNEQLDQKQRKIRSTLEIKKKLERDAYMDLRINADDQSSCKVGCYWAIIIAAIILAVFLSIFARTFSIT